MKAKEFYNTAIYLRLSRDDISTNGGADIDGSKSESNSISSQRDMIRSYIRKQDNMEIYDIYVNDGWSGANFDRPEFKRMMQDIEAGKIDCVIVKDLSRLGRDYIEAGRLIQKTFPAFSVRFIALTDHFDSLTADYNETSLVVPVKNFVNDSYCRDISSKVRSHQKVKRENGEFIGAFCVYGYRKSSENRNALIPDEYAADIVRKIFAWKIDGYSNLAIAEKLDELGILSPMEYKKMQGAKFQTGFVTRVKTKWSAVAVKRKAHIYAGLLFCGDCMEPMIRRVNRYKGKETVSFICSTKNKSGECSRHTISEEDLNYLVLTGLRQQVSLFLNKNKVLNAVEQMEINFEEVVSFDKEIEKLHKEQDKYLFLRAGLYEDLKNQIITEEDFKNFREIYENKYRELEQAICNQEETIKKLFKSGVMAGRNLEQMKSVMQITELDRVTLISFVKRILVYEDKRVYLELRYKELFSKVIKP
ncbi:recombinase family protein [Anaerosporobacter sp.]